MTCTKAFFTAGLLFLFLPGLLSAQLPPLPEEDPRLPASSPEKTPPRPVVDNIVDAQPVLEGVTDIALLPFWGTDETVITGFADALRTNLEDNAEFRPVPIDMTKLPEDVPEGGFPPYVCPSPSLIKDNPYAITGEVTRGENDGLFHARLYLWEMENNRLLFSDELAARDREQYETVLPALLEWLLSWIPKPKNAVSIMPARAEPGVEDKLFYIGLRAGIPIRLYDSSPQYDFQRRYTISSFEAALQASWNFFPFLGIQGEVIFTFDHATYNAWAANWVTGTVEYKTYLLDSTSLMFPLLLKATFTRGILYAAALGGVYFTLPLGKMNNKPAGSFNYSVDPPVGYAVGINLGLKAGPGFLFLDTRLAGDFGKTIRKPGEALYQRSMISFSIGYELGFAARKR
jgi:hypothetical protein